MSAELVALSRIADTYAGGTPSRGNKGFFGGNIPWVKSGEVKGRVCSTRETLTSAGLAASSAKWIPKGSTLLAMYGANAGDVAKLVIRATANQAVLAVVAKANVDPAYLYHAVCWVADNVKRKAQGSGQPNLSAKLIRQELIGIFPIAEQRRIAAVLDTWDDAIATAETLARSRKHRFKWIQSRVLTGHARLFGFSRPWKLTPLRDVLHEHGTKCSGSEPVFSVSVHRGLIDQVEHLGRSFAAASTVHYNLVRPGDIVYTKSPTGEFPLGIIKQSRVDREVIVSPLYGVFTPTSRELGVLLDAYFAVPTAALQYLTPLVQKGAKNTIAVTNSQFLQGKIMLSADDDEIRALSRLVETSQADLVGAEHEIAILRLQKRGLMQKLLTGEWRVPATGDALALGGRVTKRLEAAE